MPKKSSILVGKKQKRIEKENHLALELSKGFQDENSYL
jgi:hypothetical protein